MNWSWKQSIKEKRFEGANIHFDSVLSDTDQVRVNRVKQKWNEALYFAPKPFNNITLGQPHGNVVTAMASNNFKNVNRNKIKISIEKNELLDFLNDDIMARI